MFILFLLIFNALHGLKKMIIKDYDPQKSFSSKRRNGDKAQQTEWQI